MTTKTRTLADVENDVKFLRKRHQFWKGKVTRELNKAAELERKVAAGDTSVWSPSIEIQNCLTAADNYRAVVRSFASRLRRLRTQGTS